MLKSTANRRVQRVVKLHRRRQRDLERCFVVEGCRELRCAVEAGWPIETVFHCGFFFAERGERELLGRLAERDIPCEAASPLVFRKMSYRRAPDGLLGVAQTPDCSLSRLTRGTDPLWLVAAGIEKPGNLGAMLRSADAAGASGAIVADGVTDPFNPNAVRASVGALFSVPLGIASAEETRTWLDEQGIPMFAATPQAATNYTSAALTGPAAIVVGAEHAGLDAAWLQRRTVGIPMAGAADSLNAATVAALLLFEARRQRG